MLDFLSSINSPEFQSSLLWLKIPLVVAGVVFFVFILIAMFRTQWMRDVFISDLLEFLTARPYGLRRMTRTWEKIVARLRTASEDEYKLAITEADSMLRDILQRMHLQGTSMEDKLGTLTTAMISNLGEVKQAHETRNSIVHNPDYRLTLNEAQKLLDVYEETFRSLDLI